MGKGGTIQEIKWNTKTILKYFPGRREFWTFIKLKN